MPMCGIITCVDVELEDLEDLDHILEDLDHVLKNLDHILRFLKLILTVDYNFHHSMS